MTSRDQLLETARARDAERHARLPVPSGLPEGLVYLDGNSLGPLLPGVSALVEAVVKEQWGTELVRGWESCGWMDAPTRVGDLIAPLIGALPGEVIVADTTSVALSKLVGAVLRARPGRLVILTSTDNFPSDLYAMKGAVQAVPGSELWIVERSSLPHAISEAGSGLAACCLTHVDFRTGEMHDLKGVTELVHRVGGLALWDLCHSAGALVVGCEANGVDLAVGCTYKYLNGGPGSPSFIYVRKSLQDLLENPIPGWLGHDVPFDFDLDWRPCSGIRRFLTSTPPIIALACLEAAMSSFDGVSVEELRERSLALCESFIEAIDELAPEGLTVASPRDAARLGSQVSLRSEGPLSAKAAAIVALAAERGVIGDHRPPDLCRFGFAPLYVSFEATFRAAEVICEAARSLSHS